MAEFYMLVGPLHFFWRVEQIWLFVTGFRSHLALQLDGIHLCAFFCASIFRSNSARCISRYSRVPILGADAATDGFAAAAGLATTLAFMVPIFLAMDRRN